MLNNSVLRFKTTTHSKVLDDEIIELLGKNFIIPDNFSYQMVTVGDEMTARPDLLSYFLYSDDGYGDLLCKLNGIQNPFELNSGSVMICPVPSDLYKFLTDDDTQDSDETNGKKPVPKRKNEKRRPMDATPDDVRYRVDTNRRIVVY
jgi:hypothetical protein